MSNGRHMLLFSALRTEVPCAHVALKAPMVRIVHMLVTRLTSAKAACAAIALVHLRSDYHPSCALVNELFAGGGYRRGLIVDSKIKESLDAALGSAGLANNFFLNY